MPTATAPFRLETATAGDDSPPPALNIVILYDDHAAYRRAMDTLADALDERMTASDVRPTPWRFDELRYQPARGHTLEEAGDADLYLVATTGRLPVPAHVIDWLRSAFEGRRCVAPAVSVIFDAENDPHYFGALCDLLVRHEAEAAGLHFCAAQHLASTWVR